MYLFVRIVADPYQITDEGINALANLRKLESLELNFVTLIECRVFEHFKTLKKVTCRGIKNMKECLPNMIRNCRNFQEVHLLGYSSDEITEILTSAAKELKERTNIDIPLLFSCRYTLNYFKVHMSPILSPKDVTEKILFQVFYSEKKFTPDFLTYDLEILVKEAVALLDD